MCQCPAWETLVSLPFRSPHIEVLVKQVSVTIIFHNKPFRSEHTFDCFCSCPVCSGFGQNRDSDRLLFDETLPVHRSWSHRLDPCLQTRLCHRPPATLSGRVSTFNTCIGRSVTIYPLGFWLGPWFLSHSSDCIVVRRGSKVVEVKILLKLLKLTHWGLVVLQ